MGRGGEQLGQGRVIGPGGRWVERNVDLATIPIYVKAGTILPLDPVRQFTAEQVTEPTTLRVYPGTDGSFVLYDDDGATQGYLDGADPSMQWLRVSWDDAGRKVALERDARTRGIVKRPFKVEVVGQEGKTSQFAGERVKVGR